MAPTPNQGFAGHAIGSSQPIFGVGGRDLSAASAANVETCLVRRWAERLGLGLLGLFAVLTVASVVYNAA
jgi:hypothetical protein